MRAVVSRYAVLALLAACGDPAARVHLVPVDLGACGKPSRSSVSSLRVIAYTAGGERPHAVSLDAGGEVALSDLPADTLQLGVELSAATGVVAAGKTAPLAFASLPDRADVPIAVLPVGGFCATGAPVEARTAPSVALAGDGVLIVGGTAGGAPLSTAEYYDPATASFTGVDVPPELVDPANGLAGAVLTPLPDGKVALTGTAAHAIAIFDPQALAFAAPQLFDHRAYHGAIATAQDRLFVIGGCADVAAGACSGPSLHSAFTYHLDQIAMRDPGPVLPDASSRIGATVFDLGVQSDGVHRYALAGGSGDPGAADVFALSDASTTEIAGLAAQVVALDGGALVSALGPDGAPSTLANQLPPGATSPVAIAAVPLVDGARLVAAEDGSVYALGPTVARYNPTVNAWATLVPPHGPPMNGNPANGVDPGPLAAPSLVRLSDGSFLVLAGASAFLYRPALVGAASGLVAVEPDGSAPGVLVPADPSTAMHAGGRLVLSGSAVVGGFRSSTGSVNAAVVIAGDTLELVGQQQGPGRALVGQLASGSAARIVRRDRGTDTTLCTGQIVPAFDPAATTSLGLSVSGHTAVLSVATTPLATCDLSNDPDAGDSGAWGITSLDGTRLDIATITVSK